MVEGVIFMNTLSKIELDEKLTNGKKTRAVTEEEAMTIINIFKNGIKYKDEETGKNVTIRPNTRIATILQIQMTLGFRIQDILRLKLSTFEGNRIAFKEMKTKKMQYRDINPIFVKKLEKYCNENNIEKDDFIFNIQVRTVQLALEKVTKYLNLKHISTHSFRKFFAMKVYKENGNDIELVRSFLNHSSIAITQNYLNSAQEQIDDYSVKLDFLS